MPFVAPPARRALLRLAVEVAIVTRLIIGVPVSLYNAKLGVPGPTLGLGTTVFYGLLCAGVLRLQLRRDRAEHLFASLGVTSLELAAAGVLPAFAIELVIHLLFAR